MMQPLPIRFLGTGAYVPDHVLTNQHFIDYLDTNDEWILSRTGIRERRRAAANQATSDLATIAAQRALEDARLSPEDLDVIVCATATSDHQFPAAATFVQANLGARRAAAFDVGAACAGFIHASAIAVNMLQTGFCRRALVIGAETLTRFSDTEDRTTVVLFGDGAGAAILARNDNEEKAGSKGQVLYYELGCDGTRAKDIWVVAGGSRMPSSATTVAERLHFLRMRGREVYKFAVIKMQELIDRALQHTGLAPHDLKLVIPHQSNLRILESVREKMGLPPEKVAINIDRFGNTSAASIPMGLDEARRTGVLQTGDHVLMIALGAGLVWGTMVVRL